MKRPARRLTLLAGLLSAAALASSAACASATVIPLRGSIADLSALAGQWNGTYTSPDLGRDGTIWFTLVPGEDHAHGDVRMTPGDSRIPYGRVDPRGGQQSEPTQFLSVRFVRASPTNVDGVLEQYWDPACGCLATTVFRGRLFGDRLEGTFETRLATGVVALGKWRATRKALK